MCKICATNIDNEIHFLFVCSKYRTLQEEYFVNKILDTEAGNNIKMQRKNSCTQSSKLYTESHERKRKCVNKNII